MIIKRDVNVDFYEVSIEIVFIVVKLSKLSFDFFINDKIKKLMKLLKFK